MPENEVEICRYCGLPINPEDKVGHHISYKPEVIIPMHNSCHSTMHNSKEPSVLKPNEKAHKGGKTLAENTLYLSLYINKDLLKKLDAKLEGRSRNKVLNKIIEKYVENKFEIDWRE